MNSDSTLIIFRFDRSTCKYEKFIKQKYGLHFKFVRTVPPIYSFCDLKNYAQYVYLSYRQVFNQF